MIVLMTVNKIQVNVMRRPVKRLKLYETMKLDIASGVYLAGAFLPNEFELAEKYGYSRDTVRSALAMLEDDKLVELLRGKRRRLSPDNIEKAKAPLTFLLPCVDYISETFSEDVSARYNRRILKGVSQIAFEHDYRVETVPVSATNNQHDINWRKLDFVTADSMLVVLGDWYCNLFSLLLERRCRVAFVGSHFSRPKEDGAFANSCFRIIINAFGATETAVEHLYRQGCRRIALFHHYINYISAPEHPVMGGYLSGIKRCGLKFTAWHQPPEERMKPENIKKQLRDFYKKSGGFDGLLMDPNTILELRLHDFREFGLPDNIKVMIAGDLGNNQWTVPQLTSMEFPYEDIGRIAARHLLAPDFSPGEQLIDGRIVERKSASVFSREE